MSDDYKEFRKILLMVYRLHERGYQRLRIAPGLSPSGVYWRCSIAPVTNMLQGDGAMLADFDGLAALYTTGQGQQFFDWPDAVGASPDRLADMFPERFADIAAAGFGSDWQYAGWYQEMLRMTEPDALPFAYSDGFNEDIEGLPCVCGSEAAPVIIPRPPPGLAGAGSAFESGQLASGAMADSAKSTVHPTRSDNT